MLHFAASYTPHRSRTHRPAHMGDTCGGHWWTPLVGETCIIPKIGTHPCDSCLSNHLALSSHFETSCTVGAAFARAAFEQQFVRAAFEQQVATEQLPNLYIVHQAKLISPVCREPNLARSPARMCSEHVVEPPGAAIPINQVVAVE